MEIALGTGAPSKQHVLNVLGRLVEAEPPAPVTAPPALALGIEPEANVSRYDQLREVCDAA